MERFRSLARQLLEAAALGLLATALLYVPPLDLAARLDARLFDSWSKIDAPASDERIIVIGAERSSDLASLLDQVTSVRPRLVVSTLHEAPAEAPEWLLGPTEVALDPLRSRVTNWERGGHLWVQPDRDGVVRRDVTLASDRGALPSLPLAAARELGLSKRNGTDRLLRFGTALPLVSLDEALGADRVSTFADRVVVIGPGVTSSATPLGLASEPQLVAQLLDAHLAQRYLDEPMVAAASAWVVAVALYALFVGGARRRVAVAVLTGAALLLPAGSAAAFHLLGIWVPVAGPTALVLVTGCHLALQGRKHPAADLTDTDRLARARRAVDNGVLADAWKLYRLLPAEPALLPEIYDLACALDARGAVDEAAMLYERIAEVDTSFRDVAHRLVRNANGHDDAERVTMPAAIGRYQLLEPIGRGAMGNVYLGRDPIINRILALKAIDLSIGYETSGLETTMESFLREATIAGGLSHPNIVTIFDVGEADNLAFIAMEYVRGHHLSEFARSDRLLAVDTVLDLVSRAADALDYAHRRNIVHRDIKPANIMYDSLSNNLKITDFGIAKLIDANRTRTGIVLGTPAFMSPEQLEGKNVNGHTDLFALGVSLYQLLTGQMPFRGASMTSLMFVIANEPHEPVTSVRTSLPKWLDEVVDRALAKDPADRFATGAEMAAALRRAA